MMLEKPINKLFNKRTEINQEIRKIQDLCSHPEDQLTKIAKSNTGNWCPVDDSYWYDITCNVCRKQWTEDQ